MNNSKNKKLSISVIALLGIGLVFGLSSLYSMDPSLSLLDNFKPTKPPVSLIPEDVTIRPEFKGGVEKKVGMVQKVQGTVYVIHKGSKSAYRLKARHPIFEGDTIITESRSRVNAAMNDESVLALAPYAKLTVNKLQYDQKKKTRSTVMGLLWGSARFVVKKISGNPNYQVETQTAVCGVRGTDFAVSVALAPEKQSSLGHKILAWLNPAREAHAFAFSGTLISTALTGSASSVGLTGTVGSATILGPTSVAAAVTGLAAGPATVVSAAAAAGVLTSVGPQLAGLSMPPHME